MYSIVFLFLFSVELTLARVGVVMCNIKSDCPENYFCHETTCRKCLRCDMLFRKGSVCITDFKDCKECLEGFEEVLITNFSNAIKPCKPVKKKVKMKKCENDYSCPQDKFCSKESCVECFDCSLLNRLPPFDKCAKGLYECGSCMTGYNEVAVTTEFNYKPCEKIIVTIPEGSYKMSVFNPLPFIILMIIVAVGVFTLTVKKCKGLAQSKTIYQCPVYPPSAPPLYSIDSQEYVKKVEEVQSPAVGCIRETKQQAKVFKQPNASYYFHVDENSSPIDGTDNETTSTSCNPSNSIQSEETSCSSRSLTIENFGLVLSQSIRVTFTQQHNENITEENVSSSANSVVLGIINVPQVSENSVHDMDDVLPETQSTNQEQT